MSIEPTTLSVDPSPVVESVLLRNGLTVGILMAGERGPIRVAVAEPYAARMLLAEPVLRAALEQARAALPDPSFAERCNVTSDVLAEMSGALANDGTFENFAVVEEASPGEESWRYDGGARVDPRYVGPRL